MNPFAPPLAAALEDIIQVIVIFVIFVAPLIGQLLKKARQIPPPEKRPIPPRPVPPEVIGEIKEFLGRKDQAGRVEVRQAETSENRRVRNPQGPRGSKKKELPPRPAAEPARAAVVSEIASQAVQRAALRPEMPTVFAQREAELVKGASPPPTAHAEELALPFATDLFDLVGNPDSLRQAIVQNEILRRPEDRWQ